MILLLERVRLAVLVVLWIAAQSAVAEMGGEDYRSDTVIQSEAERARTQALIEAARVREAAREQQREVEALERARDREAAAARRPPGERLMIAHCTACHTLEPVLAVSHSWPGWRFTVDRMRWWNGADVPAAAAAEIVDHLFAVRPAGTLRTVVEYGAIIALGLAVMILAGFGWRGRKSLESGLHDDK